MGEKSRKRAKNDKRDFRIFIDGALIVIKIAGRILMVFPVVQNGMAWGK